MERTPRELEPLCDRIGRARVDATVHAFYVKLRAHPLLQKFFAHIPEFATHERHIADFWWLALGGRLVERPRFDMIGRHRPLGLDRAALNLWLALFEETLREQVPLELALAWQRMAIGNGDNLLRVLQGQAPSGLNIIAARKH